MRKKRAQFFGWREGGYIWRPMSERRRCHETGHEEQDVNSRKQNQGRTTESRNRFFSAMIYIINE